jgi:putative FmdB family regulatory protein
MPIYEYECPKCEKRFEKLVFGNDEVQCPTCNGGVRRVMSCCSFKSGAGDFKATETGTGKSSCGTCSSTSCATCH